MPIQNTCKYLLAVTLVACAASLPIPAQSGSSSTNASLTCGDGDRGRNRIQPAAEEHPGRDARAFFAISLRESHAWTRFCLSPGRNTHPFREWRLLSCALQACASSRRITASTTPRAGTALPRAQQALRLGAHPDGSQAPIALPQAACPGEPVWSADGKHFAFVNIARRSGRTLDRRRQRPGSASGGRSVRLNPMFGDEMQWMPDQKTLLVKLVPDGMGAPPPEPIVPNRPEHPGDGRQKRPKQHL
jgi:hypothetical protein